MEFPSTGNGLNTLNILSSEQISFYNTEGYLHIRHILPPDLLRLSRYVLSRWVDHTIDRWQTEGLISDPRTNIDFQHRFLHVWHEAGKPDYIRSPRRDLVCPEMYQILVHPALLDLAEDLLQTDEVSVHGIFNARPKLPDQKWTDTPWHQDAQYYRDAEQSHVVSVWYPLQPVTEENSCLQVAPGLHDETLHEGYKDEETGFLGVSKKIRESLAGLSIKMERGDILCFPQKMPHRALPNRSDAVRWSMDVRYEPTDQATLSGRDKGFIARSPGNQEAVECCDAWLARWDGIPLLTY